MKNVNKKSINLGFKILSILAFGLIFVPFNRAAAVYPVYVYGGDNNDGTYTFGHVTWNDSSGPIDNGADGSTNGSTNNANNNPVPRISSISPKSGAVNMNTNTLTISGKGFTPSSVVRFNTSTRPATFIDPTHLLVSVNRNDLYSYQNNGGFFVTVFNGAPGGGYSNGVYFTIKNANGTGATNDGNSLVSNAIFGTNSILPSGLVQWLILGIFILVIIILVRKTFGADKKYHKTPLKHA